MTALHGHSLDAWPFDDAVNTSSFTCTRVLDGAPILRVSHDDDGDWQFLCGGVHDISEGRIVCLACMVVRDSSLIGLAGLPLGWGADRDHAESPWICEENAPIAEDDES